MVLSKELLELAIRQTSQRTGFIPDLIEKDYYCSLILKAIFSNASHRLIFKGGTLLNKVHVGFYRLSEDLDFSVSIVEDTGRKAKSSMMKPIKTILDNLVKNTEGLSFRDPFQGHNSSSQYNACFEYESVSSGNKDTVLFDIGLREEILISPEMLNAQTLVTDPITGNLLIEPFPVQCLSKTEAYAEKLRAALTRTKPAIRDIFDLDFALRNQVIDLSDKQLQDLAKIKLCKPEVLEINLSDSKKQILKSQLEAQLRPVLREEDYMQFDFEKAWSDLQRVAEKLT
ncbi:MAG: nucleotidyl transferase AbiEii/AbiGii toxin family protein [Candidatus Caenarcaniphilales bacterium]|jgi:predicted nucleotidyltransferase component of viral defense system|nr:nucleotidyl transferase AbiEii/AbiGii toxin family protein [Candidatus Caenarcaniphilales bacterium]